jgi:hypothetical protein
MSFCGRCHLGFGWGWAVRPGGLGFGSFLQFLKGGAGLLGGAPVAVLEGLGFVVGSGEAIGALGDGGVEDLGGDSLGLVVAGFGLGYGGD